MTQVLKKSGMLQEFDENKIKRAIEKSATRVVIELTEAQKDQVCKQVKNSLLHTEVVPVSTLHNLVETALDTVEPKVAKSYREYRDNKASFARMLDKVYNKKLSLSFIGDRSNANADSAIVTTQRAIVYNELNSELYKKFFLTVEEEKAMSEGYIYIHDRGSRLDSFNCCLSDVKEILTGGFEMGNLHYNEPKTLDVAFDLIGDIIMNMASCQYGGYTISEIDKLLAPYAKKSYDKYYSECLNNLLDAMKNLGELPLADFQERYLETKSNEYAMKKVRRDFEQGWQGLEMKLNSVGSSRGDYPFTAVSFGLGKDRFETMCTSVALDVRKNGQGKEGFKHPVLFPKLSFLYDEDLHGEGKELEWLFLEAIDCSSKSMYPDFISCTGDGYCGDIYRKYGKTISRMGCRATLAPWYVRGGFQPADENDYPIFEGRMNMGAISIHFPMILKKAQLKAEKENKNVDDVFFDELNYYCNLIRDIHKRTFDTFAEKKAGTNPMAFCQGGIYGGHFNPEEKIGREFLRPMTASFGITALNETQYLYNGKSLVEDQNFAIRILQWMDDLKKRATKEDGILYALYGTPAESLCFSGETIVQTYGGNKKIKDITTDDLVYSYNEFTNKIELKKVLASKKTKSNAVVVKVTFDNNQEIICTPDHPFGVRVVNKDAKGMWSGGEKINYISADNLKPGMRVKSNYMQLHGDYIETSTDQLVHRLVYEHFNGSIPNGYIIHHKDGNKLNNRIENLQLMSSKEHRVEHLHDTIGKYTFTHENTTGVNNPFYGKKHTEESKEKNRQAHLGKEPANKILINEEQFANNYLSGMTINDLTKIYPMKYGAVRNRLIKLGLLQQNHKVKSVEVLKDLIDVYDIEVEDNHNFFVGGDDGILVHNCGLQVEQYRKMFGEQEGITDKPYTSNSFHCAVYEDINPIQKQDIEYKMYHYCTGGAIQYCRYPIDYNKDAIITLVRRAMKMGFYEGINLQLDYCEECGHQFIDSDTCPKCGSDNITRIERMNGYLGYSKVHGRTMYADHKLQEFKDRKSM